MAATPRLSTARQGAENHSSFKSKTIDVDEELSKLQPSQRLLDYYREKISKLNADNQQLKQLLEQYKKTVDPTFGEAERQKMSREIIELQSALSDVNVFIHAERQQVARLFEENERLQLECLESEKKVALLLSLSGLTEGELHVFLRDPNKTTILKQRLPPHLKQLRKKLLQNVKKPEESEVEVALRARAASLEKQLEESERNWQRERNALHQDRSLIASEHKAQVAKDEAHIKLLTARLEDAQRLLGEAVKETLERNSRLHDAEMKWLAERDHLLSVFSTVQESLPALSQLSHMQVIQAVINTIERSGSYTDLAKPKSTCELKELRRENECLKHEVEDAESLKSLYESQCLQLEQRMCKLREQKETAEQLYKERSQKLMKQIEILKQDQAKLGERRRTDLRGFQSEIRFVRNDIKTLVHQLYKITMAVSGGSSAGLAVDFSTLSDMQAVSTLTRTVQNTISDLRRRMLKIEGDLVNPVQ